MRANGTSAVTVFEERKKRIVVWASKGMVTILVRDGCKLSNVSHSRGEKMFEWLKPGTMIATIEAFGQKHRLMKNQNFLKNGDKYKKVYIENDFSPKTRNTD